MSGQVTYQRARLVERAAAYGELSPAVAERLVKLLPDEALVADGTVTALGAAGVGAAAQLYVPATRKTRERHRLIHHIASGGAGPIDEWLALRTGRRVWEIVPPPVELTIEQSRNTVVYDPIHFLEFLDG